VGDRLSAVTMHNAGQRSSGRPAMPMGQLAGAVCASPLWVYLRMAAAAWRAAVQVLRDLGIEDALKALQSRAACTQDVRERVATALEQLAAAK